jgi:hypothetical protein
MLLYSLRPAKAVAPAAHVLTSCMAGEGQPPRAPAIAQQQVRPHVGEKGLAGLGGARKQQCARIGQALMQRGGADRQDGIFRHRLADLSWRFGGAEWGMKG